MASLNSPSEVTKSSLEKLYTFFINGEYSFDLSAECWQNTNDKRIMELNPQHPIFEKMLNFKDKNKTTMWAHILYNQALITEGSSIKDPMSFTKQISDLMLSA